MPKYVAHKDLDRVKWEACLAKDENSKFYGSCDVLDVLSPGWDGIVWGDYEGIMAVTGRKKMGVNYLAQPFLLHRLEIYGSGKMQEAIELLKEKFGFMEIAVVGDLKSGSKLELGERANFTLKIDENHRSGYNSNLKRNLKKANNSGLELKLGLGAEEMVEFFKTHKGGDLDFSEDHYEKMIGLIEVCQQNDTAIVVEVERAGQRLATAFFVKRNGRLTFVKGTANALGRQHGAMAYLFDTMLEQTTGICILDFAGSTVPGVAQFNASFGAEKEVFHSLRYNNLPLPLKWLKKS